MGSRRAILSCWISCSVWDSIGSADLPEVGRDRIMHQVRRLLDVARVQAARDEAGLQATHAKSAKLRQALAEIGQADAELVAVEFRAQAEKAAAAAAKAEVD